MSYLTKKIKAASERGRRRANARWDKDRAMRAVITESDPMKFEGRIVKRIVVIEQETKVREVVFYDFDRYNDRRRKLRAVQALSL